MTFLLGPIVVLVFFGALEAVSRFFGIPLSIFGALFALVRQTDEPRFQRRQALTMLLLIGGIVLLGGGSIYLAAGFFTQAVFICTIVGGLLLTTAGSVGSRTLRAIGRSQQAKK
ncbi:MAG: hypothetical protein C0483_04635 [Pirellula sp.]|nr:hypothetical protein [Pirellula sp.]